MLAVLLSQYHPLDIWGQLLRVGVVTLDVDDKIARASKLLELLESLMYCVHANEIATAYIYEHSGTV